MSALPVLQEIVAPCRDFLKKPAQFRPLDPDCIDQLDRTVRPDQVDLGIARSDEMDMGRRVVLRLDGEAIAMRTVDDDQCIIPSVGFFKKDAG
jgi:hypothetical protein